MGDTSSMSRLVTWKPLAVRWSFHFLQQPHVGDLYTMISVGAEPVRAGLGDSATGRPGTAKAAATTAPIPSSIAEVRLMTPS